MLCASPLEFGGAGKIMIEDDVLLANGIQMHTDSHIYNNPTVPILDQGYFPPEDIVIKKGCWIGAGCMILGGVTIGENSVIGAGSVVTKNIPDYVVAVGSPAKVIKEIKKDDNTKVKGLIDQGVKWYNFDENPA